MSLESLLPSFGDLGSASLLVLAVAVTLFFFGKLIADAKPKPTEKEDYYIDGLFFSIMYLAIPFFIVILLVSVFKITTPFPIWISILVQLVILVILDLTLYYRINQVTWKKYRKAVHETVEKTLENQTEQGQKTQSPIIANAYANLEKSEKSVVSLYDTVYNTPEKVTKYLGSKGSLLLIFSLLLQWAIYSTLKNQELLSAWSILMWILSFLNFSFLAVAYAYLNRTYRESRIVMKNGIEFTGTITKFGKFANVIKTGEEKFLVINTEEISYIEETVLNENPVKASG